MAKKLVDNFKKQFYDIINTNKFEDFFYKISMYVGFVLSVVTSLMNFLFNFPIITVILPIFCGSFAIITDRIVYKKNKNLSAILIMINNDFIFSPFMWLTNSGFKGGFQYFIFLFLIISITVLKGSSRFIIVTLYILTAFFLMLFEINYPEIVLKLSNGIQNNIIDMIFSSILSLVLITLITLILSNLYVYRRQKIRELSNQDPLTKQYNRRFILDALEKVYSNPNNNATDNQFAVFIDIDNFKHINDQYGHVAGDKVLCDLCNTINKNIRSSDYLARLGGDEFILILNTEKPEIAENLVKRIVLKVAEETSVTISAGITPLKGKKDLQDLLEKADELMYKAKAGGKNRVLSMGETK